MTSTKAAVWQLQDAKNRFSEVVERARKTGPQIVTRRGEEAAVVLGIEDYRRLAGVASSSSFTQHLLAIPKVPGGLHVERSADPGRKTDIG